MKYIIERTLSTQIRHFLFCLMVGLCLWTATGLAYGKTAGSDVSPTFLELTGLGGFQFGGSVDFDGGTATFDGGPCVGAMVGWKVRSNAVALLSYQYQFTNVNILLPQEVPDSSTLEMGVGYLQIGGELEFPVSKRVVPFLGLTMGASHFTVREQSGVVDWFFAATLFSGVKVPLTTHIGIRAQFRLLATILANDSETLCISGRGCHVTLDVDAMFQGDVSAGLYLAF